MRRHQTFVNLPLYCRVKGLDQAEQADPFGERPALDLHECERYRRIAELSNVPHQPLEANRIA